MSAIITDNFRRNNAKLFLTDIAGTDPRGIALGTPANVNRYYLGIGKSDKWADGASGVTEDSSAYNIAAPVGSFSDTLEVLNNVATLTKLGASNTTLVIPNVAYASGNRYKAYNSYDSSCFYATGTTLPCYAISGAGMYLCLRAGTGTTSAQPATTTYVPFSGSDGYVWIYVQAVSQAATAFITDQFIEVSQTPLTSTPLTDSAAYGGLCSSNFHVVNGGSGYVAGSTTTAVLKGSDGVGGVTFNVTLDYTVVGGAIATVTLSNPTTPTSWPKGLIVASVEIASTSGGTGAVVVPVIAPKNGYGYIPSAVMPSWYAGIAVDLANDISTDNFYTPYRQISVIRNPNTTAATANALRYLTLAGSVPSIDANTNTLIYDGTTNKPFAVADVVNTSGGNKLYFHQNYISGFSEIASAGTFRIIPGTSGTLYNWNAVTASECNEAVLANGLISGGDGAHARIAGEVVFAENRRKITRSSGQTEKIKIIIQF
jgi:hypothetical protein